LGPDRTSLRRHPERARVERAVVDAILDEALIAHVGVDSDRGDGPVVLPMAFCRVGDQLYLHGATANHLLRSAVDHGAMCVTVSILDGLVLSRSWFHHSMNFRSVVVFGRPRIVTDDEEKVVAARALVDRMAPDRAAYSRPPTPAELKATLFLAVTVDEASAKVRTGPPVEEPDDLALEFWGGVMPVRTTFGPPEPDPHTSPTFEAPAPPSLSIA
jgi:nitroimidazol reductase NimA-like FMN-containing flavoprotein (pyridoxamine 5'-phosphate oxidase superfamily)